MQLFKILSSLISAYTLLCFIRVMLSWFPGAQYSKFGRAISRICDPYLNIFRRFSFLRFSAFDFSPAIALCLLIAASTICSSLATGTGLRFGSFLAMIISMLWSVVQSILFFLILILIIRLIVYLVKGDSGNYYSIWTSVDRAITPFIYRICRPFSGGRTMPFTTALIVAALTITAVSICGRLLIQLLCAVLLSMPF